MHALSGALPSGYFELLNLDKLLNFKKSTLAQRMRAAEKKENYTGSSHLC